MANVVFDKDSAARIAKAVKYVEGLQNPEEPGEDDVVEQTGRTVIRGQFTGAWPKGTDKDVAFTADNGDSKTKTATNYFADVGADGATAACLIILAGSEWVLVSYEPESDTDSSTECREVVTSVETNGTLTLISDVVAGTATVVTGVACVNGNLTVTTTSLSTLASVSSKTVSLSDLATVATQSLTLPPQTGCS